MGLDMSSINVQSYRSEDESLLRCTIKIDYQGKYDTCSIELINDMVLLFTSDGSITENKLILAKPKSIIHIICKPQVNMQHATFIVSYFNDNQLAHSEHISASFDGVGAISNKQNIRVREIKLSGGFKPNNMANYLPTIVSPWKVNLTLQSDIVARITSSGLKCTYMAFGEHSAEVSCHDLLFLVDTNMKKIIVPIEIVWKFYANYTTDALLSFYEIVKPDCCSIDNLYYKIKVSNAIKLSDISKHDDLSLGNFVDPLGEQFNQSWMLHPDSMLPVKNALLSSI